MQFLIFQLGVERVQWRSFQGNSVFAVVLGFVFSSDLWVSYKVNYRHLFLPSCIYLFNDWLEIILVAFAITNRKLNIVLH